MKKEVVDCSVLIKIFIPEEGSKDACEWLLGWRGFKFEVFAPQLVVAEFANVIWHKVKLKELEKSTARDILKDFLQLPLRLIEHNGIVEAAFSLAVEHDITVYDSLYAALAYKLRSSLVTADRKLAMKLKSAPITIQTI